MGYANTSADQAAASAVIWAASRYFAGNVDVHLYDVTVTQSDGIGGSNDVTFNYVDYEIDLYWRNGANSQILASHVFRKYWGQDVYYTFAGFPTGTYSLRTQLIRCNVGSYDMNLSPENQNPWVNASFELTW
ncbi:hypothetical protein [Microbacterium sp.]|jgi:hypothetical protein|uniref:hypothetical protein n=1 Tax=Microbacterium sp. TaxID=51671 RepID=UPI001ACA89BE|nr:hypothetical protein [Microbacterium sp.]MBN9158401.1 hypothetical protein [Microbacterium sp.]MBS1699284.1 hypothetical protein [Actinomycetota bacterium]